MSMQKTNGVTDYSPVVPGTRGNHDLPVRFDYCDGYVGITQYEAYESVGQRTVTRVLLNPAQWAELVAFVQQKHPRSVR